MTNIDYTKPSPHRFEDDIIWTKLALDATNADDCVLTEQDCYGDTWRGEYRHEADGSTSFEWKRE